jgi:hypothetical protein
MAPAPHKKTQILAASTSFPVGPALIVDDNGGSSPIQISDESTSHRFLAIANEPLQGKEAGKQEIVNLLV